MAQWGKNDAYTNAVMWAVTGFNATPNTGVGSNRQKFYGNTTPDAYVTGLTTGQFGVDSTEMGVYNGPVNQVIITDAGTGYGATTLSAITNGGGSGANVTFSSTIGKLTGYTIVNGGSSYETNPTVTVQAPPLLIFNGNTAVTPNATTGAFIAYASANSYLAVGDKVTYAGNVTSTPVTLVNNRAYYVAFANTTGVKLSDSPGTANINFTGAPYASSLSGGATLQGTTATAIAVTGGALHRGVSHAGWVVRKVGSGGRAGRVQYETLVAMGSITGDGSDDTVLPDSNS
jgi:hypothetical protein